MVFLDDSFPLTVEYDPFPISLINLKSLTVFFGIRGDIGLDAAILVVSFVIIAKREKKKETHPTSLVEGEGEEKNVKQTRIFIGRSLRPIDDARNFQLHA